MKKMFISFLIIIAILVLVVVAYLQLPLFGASPTGERLAKIQNSPHYKNGKFQNLSKSVSTEKIDKLSKELELIKEIFYETGDIN